MNSLFAGPNFIVPTPPQGDSSNRTASTEFAVINASAAASSLIASTVPALISAALGSAIIPAVATQAQMEAATSTAVFAAPAVQQYHPSAAKAWVYYDCINLLIRASYNVTAVTAGADGNFTVKFITPFSSTSYLYVGSGNFVDASGVAFVTEVTAGKLTTSLHVFVVNASLVGVNPGVLNIVFFGDQ